MSPSANPYKHNAPIKNKEYFFGRNDIIENIEYDIKQSTTSAPQFVNIGITGKEGVGKTSLSYIIEGIAEENNISTVRIDLDEGLVDTASQIFQRIYQECSEEVGGDIEEGYINAISGKLKEVEINAKFLRILFSDNESTDLPESIVQKAFRNIYDDLDSPAILITLDNAQYLSENSVALQKLKNVFSDLAGYILCLSGTEETFDKITSAFSPVARMFNKYEIGKFKKFETTKKSILEPLSGDDKEKIDRKTIEEIHSITGGSPYEINLISYYMYKCHEMNDLEEIHLTSSVIDEVVENMEEWVRPVDNSLLNTVSNLDKLDLTVLVSSLELGEIDKGSVVQYTCLNTYEQGATNINEQMGDIEESIEKLCEEDLLNEQNNILSFTGGIYSATYIKYNAYSNEIINHLGRPLEDDVSSVVTNMANKILNEIVLTNINGCSSAVLPDSDQSSILYPIVHDENEDFPRYDSYNDKNNNIQTISDQNTLQRPMDELFYDSAYTSNIDSDTDAKPPEEVFTFRCNLDWIDTGFRCSIAMWKYDDDDAKELTSNVEELQEYLEESSIELIINAEQTLLRKAGALLKNNAINTAIDYIDKAISLNENFERAYYLRSMAYAIDDQIDLAFEDVNKAIEIRGEWTDAYCLKGSLYLIDGDEEEAKIQLEKAAIHHPEREEFCWGSSCCILDKMNEYELAIETGENHLENVEQDSHICFHLASANFNIREYEDAIDWADEFLENRNVEKMAHKHILLNH